MSATHLRRSKPVLAFTCGDPAGVGPEAVVSALRSGRLKKICEPLLVGEASVWKRAGWRPRLAAVLDTGFGLEAPPFGKTTREGGRASFAALRLAARLAGRGLVSGLVTAPISKEAWALAGVPYPDHTEYLRAATGSPGAQMILGSPGKRLWCVIVTRHIPLNRVSAALSVAKILAAAQELRGALRRLGIRRPRLGLCAFNPHAGEAGLIGDEERRVLIPAARSAGLRGLTLEGPIAADAAWRRHAEGEFDGLVALYHDQAMIALKAAAGLGVVNWTAGLPFIRTSPGHGTAFDIAGRGKADCLATVAAAELAVRLHDPSGRAKRSP